MKVVSRIVKKVSSEEILLALEEEVNFMLVTTYKCEIISPMFLHGPDNNKVEFRATPFKSMMRFWWRGFQPFLFGKVLLDDEEKLFGGIKENQLRSQFDINVCYKDTDYIEKNYLLPHKSSLERDSIKIGTEFDVNISVRGNDNEQNVKEKLESLFELASVLGGVGQRARRGAGCFRILQKNDTQFNYGNDIVDWCSRQIEYIKHGKCVVEQNDNVINFSNSNKKESRHISSVNSIEFIPVKSSLNVEKLLEHIGKCTHDSLKDNKKNVHLALGRGAGGRIASPVYVSLADNENQKYVVISRLQYSNSALFFEDDKNDKNSKKKQIKYEAEYEVLDRIQEEFIDSIRNGVN